MTGDGDTARLPDPEEQPAQWLHQFAEALDDVASGITNIVSFKPQNERQVAQSVDCKNAGEPSVTNPLRRIEKRAMHGKSEKERREIQRVCKKLAKRRLSTQDYLRAACEELLDHWPETIYQASDLVKEIGSRKEHLFTSPAIVSVRDAVRDALGCLATISAEGLSLIERWEETLVIDEFTDQEIVDELFSDAAVFAEQLRNHDMQPTLERLANRIRAHTLIAQNQPPSDEWSRPMTKTEIAVVLRLSSVDKLTALAKAGVYHLRKAGSRQSWQIRLKGIPPELREELI